MADVVLLAGPDSGSECVLDGMSDADVLPPEAARSPSSDSDAASLEAVEERGGEPIEVCSLEAVEEQGGEVAVLASGAETPDERGDEACRRSDSSEELREPEPLCELPPEAAQRGTPWIRQFVGPRQPLAAQAQALVTHVMLACRRMERPLLKSILQNQRLHGCQHNFADTVAGALLGIGPKTASRCFERVLANGMQPVAPGAAGRKRKADDTRIGRSKLRRRFAKVRVNVSVPNGRQSTYRGRFDTLAERMAVRMETPWQPFGIGPTGKFQQ
jgi:hypothetical protein